MPLPSSLAGWCPSGRPPWVDGCGSGCGSPTSTTGGVGVHCPDVLGYATGALTGAFAAPGHRGNYPRAVYWHVSDPRYAAYRHSDVIPPGNWGRIVRVAGEAHPNWRQEMLLESRREVVNPSAPSRLSSTYLYTSLRIARRWARPGMFIHPAIPLSRPFRGDLIYATWIQAMLDEGNDEEAVRGADLYWRGACPIGVNPAAIVEPEVLCAAGALVVADVEPLRQDALQETMPIGTAFLDVQRPQF